MKKRPKIEIPSPVPRFSVKVLEGTDQFPAGELESHFSSPVESQGIKPFVVTDAGLLPTSIISRTV